METAGSAGSAREPDSGGDSGIAADWSEAALGPELFTRLWESDPATADDFQLIEMIKSARRMESWAQARMLRAVSELSQRRRASLDAAEVGPWAPEAGKLVADEIAITLTMTGGAAERLVGLADELIRSRVPETRLAFSAGLIDLPRLVILTQALLGVDRDLAHKVERLVLPEIQHLTTERLRRRLRKLLAGFDPDAARERTERAFAERRLERRENPSGTIDLVGRDLADTDVRNIYDRLTATANSMRAEGDPRGVDALRADLFVALLRGDPWPEPLHEPARSQTGGSAADHPSAGSSMDTGDPDDLRQPSDSEDHRKPVSDPSRRTAAQQRDVLVGAAKLEGRVVGRLVRARMAQLVAETRSAGTTAPEVVVAVRAAQLVTESLAELRGRRCDADAGAVGGYPGSDSRTGSWARDTHDRRAGYRPSARIRGLVQARDGTCRFPTCARPAAGCDLDHTRAHHHSGATCPCNLAALCRRHHILKQSQRWGLFQPWPGVLLWTTPSGHWYVVEPDLDP